MWCCDSEGYLSEYETCRVLAFNATFFLYSWNRVQNHTGGPILMISMSHDVLTGKDVPFGGHNETASIKGDKSLNPPPILGA